jgi:hypothetical protein
MAFIVCRYSGLDSVWSEFLAGNGHSKGRNQQRFRLSYSLFINYSHVLFITDIFLLSLPVFTRLSLLFVAIFPSKPEFPAKAAGNQFTGFWCRLEPSATPFDAQRHDFLLAIWSQAHLSSQVPVGNPILSFHTLLTSSSDASTMRPTRAVGRQCFAFSFCRTDLHPD